MNEIDFKQILDIINQLLPIIIPIVLAALGAPSVKRYIGKQKANQIAVIVQTVYLMIENAKRQHKNKTKENMPFDKIMKLFEANVRAELEANGIKPTDKIIEQCKRYSEAKHVAVRGIK